MDSVKMLVGQVAGSASASTEEPGFMEEVQGRLSMSRTHRMYGFGACMALGVIFLFISTTLIIMPEKFAFTFTTANILLMGSTMFLIGPIRQLKMMFDPVRMCATVCYLLSLVMALFCALKLHSFFLTVIAIILEAIAIAWYALSYIPFARSMAKTMLHSCFPRIF
ncbi:hypothetical protein MPTK1_3g03700 [Marchantia polymorpha subsp. ruderalis]|uniref:Vesicle transport protein n=2 Tax=Marchantia polymorpha TaxID=3197 RepID=A0AAF6AX45_MARPO|nr:hypothetical protein MARPO_0022s0162 [Marchantia polymorpha]BBN04329.1 hypothetical protein Mp_3g03700 [Marchantia polymorpha subsp. ruderalis]|eukprot:PTQ44076.1 hypothetical protein MARPO_0022s0162 [Marchantia polymorpha]